MMLNTLEFLLPHLNELCSKKMLIVTSIGKSGSTWVQKILDAHTEIYCGGESKIFEIVPLFFESVNKYNTLLSHTNKLIYKDDFYFAPWKDLHRVASVQFFMALALVTAKKPIPRTIKYIGDKDTSYIHNIDFWRSAVFPKAKIIHVIRDGRDAFLSNIAHLSRQGERISHTNDSYFERLKSWAAAWNETIISTRKACSCSPDLYLEVQYENLLSDPVRETRKIFSYLDVDATPSIVSDCCRHASFENLSGGRRRGCEDVNSFFRKGVRDEWEAVFDEKAKEIFYQEAKDTLVDLGYKL